MSTAVADGIVEQVTSLVLRDPATDVEVACEWLPAGNPTLTPMPAPAGWRVTAKIGREYIGTGDTGRIPDLDGARLLAHDLLELAAAMHQAKRDLDKAEARLRRRIAYTRDGAP